MSLNRVFAVEGYILLCIISQAVIKTDLPSERLPLNYGDPLSALPAPIKRKLKYKNFFFFFFQTMFLQSMLVILIYQTGFIFCFKIPNQSNLSNTTINRRTRRLLGIYKQAFQAKVFHTVLDVDGEVSSSTFSENKVITGGSPLTVVLPRCRDAQTVMQTSDINMSYKKTYDCPPQAYR